MHVADGNADAEKRNSLAIAEAGPSQTLAGQSQVNRKLPPPAPHSPTCDSLATTASLTRRSIATSRTESLATGGGTLGARLALGLPLPPPVAQA